MIDAKNFPGRGKVAILRTRPETVLDDYYKLMRLCDYDRNLPQNQDTLLKINISWQIWYPGCSTTPWQLDGVIRTLLRDGYPRERLIAAHNNTVVVDAKEGAVNNRHAPLPQLLDDMVVSHILSDDVFHRIFSQIV